MNTLTAFTLALSFLFLFSQFHSIESAPHCDAANLKETVILISSDGFRFGYQFKNDTPNIGRLINEGTEAELGLIPVFPSLTFPNHYSIVTGLYPAHHGIVNNQFMDPQLGKTFSMSDDDVRWWLGEPLWETVVKNDLKAAAYFWPGSEVNRPKWSCPSDFCFHYDSSVKVPFEERVDTILKYFDHECTEIPAFMALYLEDPDAQGHLVGPDDHEISEAVGRIDSAIGRLIKGLEQRKIFDKVHIILVGDHGMAGTCDKKLIFYEDLGIQKNWVESYSALLAVRPDDEHSPEDVLKAIKEKLKKANNGDRLKVFLKKDLPARLLYSGSDRIPPIIGLADEGYKVVTKVRTRSECGGAHGYDNALFSMRSIFIGRGPRFEKRKKVPSFQNVEIYNMVTSILKIEGAHNDGTAKSILLPINEHIELVSAA